MRWKAMLTVVILGLSMPALACSIMLPKDRFRDDFNSFPVDQFIATRMWENAAYIDIVDAVSMDQPSSYQERHNPFTPNIVFRVFYSLKGGAEDEFIMEDSGVFLSEPDRHSGEPFRNRHTVTFDGHIEPSHSHDEQCRSSFRKVSLGHRYLLFRDADGKLLGPVELYPDVAPSWGYSLTRLSRSGGSPGDGQWETINRSMVTTLSRLRPASRPEIRTLQAQPNAEARACSPKAVTPG